MLIYWQECVASLHDEEIYICADEKNALVVRVNVNCIFYFM